MKSIIIYGSTTGNAEDAAKTIKKSFDDAELTDVSDFNFDTIGDYDLLLLGTSTFGSGDLQDDWEGAIDKLDNLDLSGKHVAIFGTGDQYSYPDTFASSLNYIYEKVENSGAKIIGLTSTEGYEFDESDSVRGDNFVGLVLDYDNQAQLIDDKISNWITQINSELN